jgi:cell division septation protein DedD
MRITSKKIGWLTKTFLAVVLVGSLQHLGLRYFSDTPPPPRSSGEVRLMSFTGFSARPAVVRKKIDLVQPTLSATAFSFVITRKITPAPFGSSREAVSAPAPEKTVPPNKPVADALPLPAVPFPFADRWWESNLISRLGNETDASRSLSIAAAPTSAAASPSGPLLQETAAVSAVRDRPGVSPMIEPASKRTTDTGSASDDRPQVKEAPPARPSPEPAVDFRPIPALPFSLQLSSCRSLKNAQNAVLDFRKMGLEPFIAKVYLANHGGCWWRVLSGQYASAEAALRAQRALGVSTAIVKRTRFATLIGEYPTQDLTAEIQKHLENLGFSAYSVKNPDRGFRLFVGAFTRKSQAEEQAVELRAKGMVCRVVTR